MIFQNSSTNPKLTRSAVLSVVNVVQFFGCSFSQSQDIGVKTISMLDAQGGNVCYVMLTKSPSLAWVPIFHADRP